MYFGLRPAYSVELSNIPKHHSNPCLINPIYPCTVLEAFGALCGLVPDLLIGYPPLQKVVYTSEIHFCVTADLYYPRWGEWPSPAPCFHHEDHHTNDFELVLAHSITNSSVSVSSQSTSSQYLPSITGYASPCNCLYASKYR